MLPVPDSLQLKYTNNDVVYFFSYLDDAMTFATYVASAVTEIRKNKKWSVTLSAQQFERLLAKGVQGYNPVFLTHGLSLPAFKKFISKLPPSTHLPMVSDFLNHFFYYFNVDIKKTITFLGQKLNFLVNKLNIDSFTKDMLSLYLVMMWDKTNKYKTDITRIANVCFEQPLKLKAFNETYRDLRVIELIDSGGSHDLWSQLTRLLVSHAPAITTTGKKHQPDNTININRTFALKSKLAQNEYQFLRLQGRTILYQNPTGKILALKVQKQGEDIAALEKEYLTQAKCQLDKENIQSAIPTPRAIFFFNHVFGLIQHQVTAYQFTEFESMVGNKYTYQIFAYTLNPTETNYLTYLHAPTLRENAFANANHRIATDLAYFLGRKKMAFNQLADLFHENNQYLASGRADHGRYMVLVNLLRDNSYSASLNGFLGETNIIWGGTGELMAWRDGVKYPNVRESGLADLGDHIALEELIDPASKLINTCYGDANHNHKKRVGNYTLANLMAEYQYILFLVAGVRGRENTNTQWSALASQVVSNCAHFTAVFTHDPIDKLILLFSTIIDVHRLANQMEYWMTPMHIKDLSNCSIQQNIYSSSTHVFTYENTNELAKNKWFNTTIGTSLDGKREDLGFESAQEPIKEMNKLLYWMVSYIFTKYHTYTTTLTQLRAINSEGNIQKSEALRAKSFLFLPKKQQTMMQLSLCNARLDPNNKPLPKATKAKIEKERLSHSAYLCQSIWRQHRPTVTERPNKRLRSKQANA